MGPKITPIGPQFLGAAALGVGLLIGTGIRQLFVEVEVPEKADNAAQTNQRVTPWDAGDYVGIWYSGPLPEDGWYWSHSAGSNYSGQDTTEFLTDASPTCFSAVPPQGFITYQFPNVGPSCAWQPTSGRAVAYVKDLRTIGPIVPHTGQPYSYSLGTPTAPNQATVEDDILDLLSDPESAEFKQWVNYILGSPGESDPTGVGLDNPDIGFPDWRQHWEDHGEEFDPDYADAHAYWRGAAHVIERADDLEEDFYKWTRASDGATIFVDDDRGAVVIVEDDVIVDFYVPTATQLNDLYFERADDDFAEHDGVDETVRPDRLTYPWAPYPSTDWRRWCELSAPGAGGAISSTPGWFDSYTTPPSFTANTIGTADLLYGTAFEFGFGPWSDIKGFGVRKIAAKHGWTSADVSATAAALLTTPTGPAGQQARYVYRGAPYSPPNPSVVDPLYASTGHCERVVVVGTVARPGEPRSRGIITSFGDWTGGHA